MRRWLPVVLVALAPAGCERQAVPVSMETARGEDAPVHESWNARLQLSSAGRQRLGIRSAYQASFERGDSAYVLMTATEDPASGRVVAVVYGEDGDTTAVVQADRLYWYEEDERFEARGDVVVDGANGNRVESEYLEWDEGTRVVRTPGFSRVRVGPDVIEGYGLTADEALEDVTMANLTGQVEVDEE